MITWFPDWILEHRIRHPHAALPDPETTAGDVFYQAWILDLERAGATLAEATEASQRLQSEVYYPSAHWATFLTILRKLVRNRLGHLAESGWSTDDTAARAAEKAAWAALSSAAQAEVLDLARSRYPLLSDLAIQQIARGWAMVPALMPGPKLHESEPAATEVEPIPRRIYPWSTGKIHPNVPASAG